MTREDILKKEAQLFSRYLIDAEPPDEMIQRYIEANHKLGIDIEQDGDARIMNFARRNPWSIFLLFSGGMAVYDVIMDITSVQNKFQRVPQIG